jgi:tRNA-uridine 2-sulfurtransferase
MNKLKVLLAMSGGTDSSVAAMLLKEQNYSLYGMTFRVYDSVSQACLEKETGCCSVDAIYEAKNLAKNLGFDHEILDLRDYFDETVIKNFINEYLAGRTPNPCVECNRIIKWEKMIEEADRLGCHFLATGHYAKIINQNGRYFIRKGADDTKDQSYFLWTLTQENLKRSIFPLGELTKKQVREIAKMHNYNKIAEKRESQEICFIPDDDYRRFLRDRIKNIEEKIGEGDVYDSSGKFLGKHKGYPFYTIGQRKGLNIAVGHPVYVISIDPKNNVIVIGEKHELESNELLVGNFNLMKYESIPKEISAVCKIRYNNDGQTCKIKQQGDYIKIVFNKPVSAVTSGQSAVFYDGNDVIGGGIII